MIKLYLLLLFVSFSFECAPTVPVATTTISPVTTSTISQGITSTYASNTTTTSSTTPTPTTTSTVNRCCSYPIQVININTVNPVKDNWNGCNQSVYYNCSISADTGLDFVGFAFNITNSSTTFGLDNVFSATPTHVSPETATVAILMCNMTSGLWNVNGTNVVQASTWACAYGNSLNNTYTIRSI